MSITHVDNRTGQTITTHTGRVLAVYSKDYRAMSDIYTYATFAMVINEKGMYEEIMVNANFECDVSQGRATVDATMEVLEIKHKLDTDNMDLQKMQAELIRKTREEEILNRPMVGMKMVVSKGRKAPVGTVGVVSFIHSSGRVLLKNEKEWKDRKANGVWVESKYLRAM